MGCFEVTIEEHESFGAHPESQRYLKILDGKSLASVRVDQGLSGAASAATAIAGKLKRHRSAAKERKATQQGIEAGEIQDLSG